MNTSRREFAKTLVGTLPVSRLWAAASSEDFRWRERRIKLAHRRRRLIYNDSWKEFAAIAREDGVPAYPAYDCALLAHMPHVELLRCMAMNCWMEGAPGIYLFNPFVPPDLKKIPPELIYSELGRVGDAVALRGLNKVYCPNYLSPSVDPKQFVWTYGATVDRPLPAKVSRQPQTFPLLVVEDLADVAAGRKCKLSLKLLADKPDTAVRLAVKLNGRALEGGEPPGEREVEFKVALSDLHRGTKDVAVASP